MRRRNRLFQYDPRENRKLQVETPSAGQMPPMPAAEALHQQPT
jgi:hypothetical protein